MIKSTFSILFFILIAPTLAIAELPALPENPDVDVKSTDDLGGHRIDYDASIYLLKSAKSIECYFPQGMRANWQGKTMELKEDHMPNAVHFNNIDISDKKQARMIGSVGASDVRAFMSPIGITLLKLLI